MFFGASFADRNVLDRHDLQGDWDSTRARRSYSPSSIALHALPTIRALVLPSTSHTKEQLQARLNGEKGIAKLAIVGVHEEVEDSLL